MPDRAERPDLLPDGYRVTLECGHHYRERALRFVHRTGFCDRCGDRFPVLDVIPAYAVRPEPPAAPEVGHG